MKDLVKSLWKSLVKRDQLLRLLQQHHENPDSKHNKKRRQQGISSAHTQQRKQNQRAPPDFPKFYNIELNKFNEKNAIQLSLIILK